MPRLPTISCAISLALISPVSSAVAEDQQVNFRYDPAEVATVEAAAKLYERIVSFAKAECRMISNPPVINPRSEKCTKELADQIVANINSPLLVAHAKGSVNLAAAER